VVGEKKKLHAVAPGGPPEGNPGGDIERVVKNGNGETYDVVLDAVNLGVFVDGGGGEVGSGGFGVRGLGEVVLDLADFEDAEFLEGPGGEGLGKVAVGGLFALGSGSGEFDFGVEPFVGEEFDGTEDEEARVVAGLEGGDER
jgi:hypothetical protein